MTTKTQAVSLQNIETNYQNERTEPILTIENVVGIKVTEKKRQTCCGWV